MPFQRLATQKDCRERVGQKRGAWPRWLRRDGVADYLSISPSQVDKWRSHDIIPSPQKILGIVLWDRLAVDESMEAIFYPVTEGELTKWDDLSV